MTETRLRPAGPCKTCAAPMVSRPHRATVALLPPGHRFHTGRGLCASCYDAAKRRGELADFECVLRSSDDLLDDWVIARARGMSYREFADLIGATYAAVEAALVRARRRNDPRAQYSIPSLRRRGVPA